MSMRTPATAQLLDLWDGGQALSPTRRALSLLAAALPAQPGLEHWPLGTINRELLLLRGQLFGPGMACLADCGACGEVVEIEAPVAALLAQAPVPALPLSLASGQYEVAFHVLSAHDVMALERSNGSPQGGWLEQAVDSVSVAGAVVPLADLTAAARAALQQAVEQAIEAADPLAHIAFALTCPACAQHWSADLHIIDVLWSEIGAWAERVFSEVGRLAQAFGWSEAEILALPATRRMRYLEWLET